MVHRADEVADVQLLLQLKVKNFRRMLQLHCDIYVVIEDVGEDLVDRVKLHGAHGVAKFLLLVVDVLGAGVAAADRALLLLIRDCLEDPHRLGALDAEEKLARLAVVADVLEVKLAVAALLVSTVLSGCRLLYQFLHL